MANNSALHRLQISHLGVFLQRSAVVVFCFFPAYLFLPSSVLGCPVVIYASDLDPALEGRRSSLQLFALTNSNPNSWIRQTLQIDPVNEDGRLVFFEDDYWRNAPIGPHDRVVFEGHSFGRVIGKNDSLPCKGRSVHQIRDALEPNRVAYLTICKDGSAPSDVPGVPLLTPTLTFDQTNHVLRTESYRYEFSPRNHMLFRRVGIGKTRDVHSIAENSDILIRADIKNFFKFRFNSTDIESYLEEFRLGPVAATARVSFFLRIFYVFTLRLSLTTDVSFFRDSANIPMVIHIPNDADNHLHPGSGIVYSWEVDDGDLPASGWTADMPSLDQTIVGKIRSGPKSLSSLGLASCIGSTVCRYQFQATPSNADGLRMEFSLRRAMVERGFFPILVPNAQQSSELMDWNLAPGTPGKRRTGFYFETSGLRKGSHPWDFWLRLGEQGSKSKDSCPRPVFVTPL